MVQFSGLVLPRYEVGADGTTLYEKSKREAVEPTDLELFGDGARHEAQRLRFQIGRRLLPR
eukprot:4129914-Prorocentrum_lima.AAC.1